MRYILGTRLGTIKGKGRSSSEIQREFTFRARPLIYRCALGGFSERETINQKRARNVNQTARREARDR